MGGSMTTAEDRLVSRGVPILDPILPGESRLDGLEVTRRFRAEPWGKDLNECPVKPICPGTVRPSKAADRTRP